MTAFVRLSAVVLAVATLAACAPGNVVSRGDADGSWTNTRTTEYPTKDAAPVMEKAVTK